MRGLPGLSAQTGSNPYANKNVACLERPGAGEQSEAGRASVYIKKEDISKRAEGEANGGLPFALA